MRLLARPVPFRFQAAAAALLAGLLAATTVQAQARADSGALDQTFVPPLCAPGVEPVRAGDESPEETALLDEFRQRAADGSFLSEAYIDTLRSRAADPSSVATSILAGILTLRGGPGDPAEARRWIEAGAAAGRLDARLNIAVQDSQARGPDSQQIQANAVRTLIELAKGNDGFAASATSALARATAIGLGGLTPDRRRAAMLADCARLDGAFTGDTLFILALAIEDGVYQSDPPMRAREVLDLYREAAELGSGAAAWRAGMMIRNGDGTRANPREAYRWVRRAAELDNVEGMISLAVMLATGEGVAENDAQARQWYERAAQAGSSHALASLGAMHVIGEGGPVDEARGIALLRIAATRNANAREMLAAIARMELEVSDEEIDAETRAWLEQYGPPQF